MDLLLRQPQLQTLLEGLLGSRNVYFQPPPNIQMAYPAIRYELDGNDVSHADNIKYRSKLRWQLTVIDSKALSVIPGRLADLQYCAFDRRFVASNLYHSVFTLYF